MTTQPTTAAPPVTLEEYAALPKHPRYELVKGVLVELMVASDEHEETVILSGLAVWAIVYPNRLGKVYGSNRGYVTGPDSPATSGCPTFRSFPTHGWRNPTWRESSTTVRRTSLWKSCPRAIRWRK